MMMNGVGDDEIFCAATEIRGTLLVTDRPVVCGSTFTPGVSNILGERFHEVADSALPKLS